MPHKILVIEDEPAIADNILFALSTERFKTAWKATGKDGLAEAAKEGYDLIVLDVGLPDIDGFELCREIRKKSRVPILFLTARTGEVDRVLGLELGADDYLTKPFSPRELTARIKAILRRTSPSGKAAPAPSGGSFTLDEVKQGIFFKGKKLPLSRHEFLLLKALLAHPGRVYSREALMEMAWESPGSSQARTVDAHVKSLRKKLKAAGARDPISTQRGFGYSLETGA